jgi:plasmid replication initiation protein
MSETHNIQPYKNPELVVLRNPVARAKFGLSLVQTKFLFEVLAFFKDHPEKRFARFYMRDYLHKLGVSSNNFREYVRQVEDMRRRDINIPRSDSMQGINFIGVSLFSSAEYRLDENGDGYIEIEVSDKLKPYFLEIAKGDFFYYHILNTRVLKSTYSIKLYLLLKSYRRFGKLEIPLSELRSILEINDDEYLQYKNFKARVLETARLEMEEKNDICFRYEDTRRSRKSPVEKIIFFIYDNPNAKEILEKARRMFEQDKTIEPIVPKNAPAQSLDLFSSSESISIESTSDEPIFYTSKIEKKSLKIQKTKLKPKNTEGVQNLDNLEKAVGQTSLSEVDATPKTQKSSVKEEILALFRLFDKDAPDSDIFTFVEGYDSEKVLDVLYYAKEQMNKGKTEIKNIYPYLVAGVRSGYGKGLTAKNRLKQEKEQLKSQLIKEIANVRLELDKVVDDYEKSKNDKIREITGANPETTNEAIESIKKSFGKINPSVFSMTVEDFRVNPMYREIVKKEIYDANKEKFMLIDSVYLPEIDRLKKLIIELEKR